jgi:hypothetical protein
MQSAGGDRLCARLQSLFENDSEKERQLFYFFFSLMKRSKNHPTAELAKNLIYSLNLPILPQSVDDF